MLRASFFPFALSALFAFSACGGGEESETAASAESPASGDETEAVVAPAEPPAGDPAPEEPGGETEFVVGDDPCETDADCAPAACCHAASCVAVGNAPSCEETMCTMECRGGTMDCGGGCLCHEGKCAARVIPGPEMALGVQ